jgi:hypothetical protein
VLASIRRCNAGHLPSIALVKEPTFDNVAVFRNFGEQFKLDDKVIQQLLSLGMESLDDVYHYVSTTAEIEDKVTSRVARITDIAGLQSARLRKAWKSLGDALSQASKATALGQTGEDLDVPLGKDGADRLKERVWCRYHMRFPIHVEPDDRFVQRIHKELLIRCLSLHDPMKVKAAAIKPKALRSERLTDKLALTEIHDVEESRPETVSGYLSGLRTLMIALARAGCIPIDNQIPESFDTATLLYVECPLDITLAYYFKCEKAVLSNNGDRLQWLRTRDEDDSSEWFYRLQKTLTIGNIIATVAVECAAIWQAENPSRAQASQCQDGAKPSHEPPSKEAQDRVQSAQILAAEELGPASRAHRFHVIRRQHLPELEPQAVQGPLPWSSLGLCNVLVKGRACGMRNHCALDHKPSGGR